jgi:hypothetical protein
VNVFVDRQNTIIQQFLRRRLEWEHPFQTLEGHYTHAPPVHFFAMFPLLVVEAMVAMVGGDNDRQWWR